ncbi:MAG: exodeoxyribonuclease VII small subunit [Verrucomicrobia bacterium]|nr:exodeoxyribonuclease VII small subunit [Verrucomicrobiota bacterium]
MSKAARSSAANPTPPPELPYEEALARLEAVVDSMESGDLPLESLLAKYEEGVKLAEICQARLRAAEGRIQQLEKNAAGEPVLRPFDPDAESDSQA